MKAESSKIAKSLAILTCKFTQVTVIREEHLEFPEHVFPQLHLIVFVLTASGANGFRDVIGLYLPFVSFQPNSLGIRLCPHHP